MSRVRIVTDSTCDLSRELLDEYNISLVPLKVMLDSVVYRDRIDLSPADFYQRLPGLSKLPTTSQPSPGEFVAVYESLADRGYQVISIHISGGLSGTVQAAELAASMVPGLEIQVVDSRTVAGQLGLLVLAAAKAAREGKDMASIVAMLHKLRDTSRIYFVLDTLEYLQKGGRIGKSSAFIGNLMNIKPILSMQDGVVSPVDKVRGRNKALDRMRELVREGAAGRPVRYCILHGSDDEVAYSLMDRMQQEFGSAETPLLEISPVLGTYAGPGAIGIAYYPLDTE
ncbi:MAG TPA: DegV family protein [Bacillota bacterium]|nr:DegV family protein [Bacillota bacterium]